jgi:two-component system cell cycle response regulator DivK
MQKKYILIIDDDHRNIFALKAVLKTKGYNCITALTGKEGLDILNKEANIFVVLMDMMMPDMDGYQTINLMQQSKKLQQIPVIAVTAQAMPGDKERCIAGGADGYVAKPINIDLLLNELTKFAI